MRLRIATWVLVCCAGCGKSGSGDDGRSKASGTSSTESAAGARAATKVTTRFETFDQLVDAYLAARTPEALAAMFPNAAAIETLVECPTPEALKALVDDMAEESVRLPPEVLDSFAYWDKEWAAHPELAAEAKQVLAEQRARSWKSESGYDGHKVLPKGGPEGQCVSKIDSEEQTVGLLSVRHVFRARKFGDAGWFVMFINTAPGG